MAYVIPVVSREGGERGPMALIVVLTKENLERMREADPFDVQVRNLGPVVVGFKATDVDIIIAYEEDESFLMEAQKSGDIRALLAHIERGRKHRPELGDATKPFSIRRKGN